MAPVKRGKIRLSGTPIFRISSHGHDVDTAAPQHLLIDESVLQAQVWSVIMIDNPDPFTQYPNSIPEAEVFFPALPYVPRVIPFTVSASGGFWKGHSPQYLVGAAPAPVCVINPSENSIYVQWMPFTRELGLIIVIFRIPDYT